MPSPSTDDLIRIVAVARCPYGIDCNHDQCPCCAEADHVHEAAAAFVYYFADFQQLKVAAHEYLALTARDPDLVARWATDGLPEPLLTLLGVKR